MKIRQLHINRFGHFIEYDLVFPGEGLQVIYGPNEAGKTTLLEFLRGLLFDFPVRTPYDFGGPGEMAGFGTFELRGGRAVELRRRKGNKDKVAIKLDGQPTDLGDADWLRLLDHADRGLFESVFAFGLDQLSQGEASLKHESLQSALFGASLGGTTSPDKVIAELNRQADDLFKKTGRTNPKINVLLLELSRLKKEIKASSLRPEKYREAEATAANVSEQALALHQRVDRLRLEHSKIEKRIRAWPKWWELQQQRSQRAGLTVPENISAEVRQQYLVIAKELKSVAEEQVKRREQIKEIEHALLVLKLDPAAVSYRSNIKSCLELRQSFIEAKEQLPERKRAREAMRLLIDRELDKLRPGWSHDDLRTFSVDVATLTAIDRLSDEHSERTSSRTTLVAKRDGDASNLERAQDELIAIGSPRDVTTLVAVLADEANYVAHRKQSDGIRIELAKLDRKLVTQRHKLSPPLSAEMSTPHDLPVPRAETISEFDSQFADIREDLRTAISSVKEDEADQSQIENSLSTTMSGHVVPSLDERDAARERRDLGWSLIRKKYISSEQADSAIAVWLGGESDTPLPDGYERAIRVADNVVDQIYDNANEVAKREELRRRLASLEVRLDQKRNGVADLERKRAELQATWYAVWRACGFEPLAPDAMLNWLKDHEATCVTIALRQDLSDELSQLGERIASFEQRLRAAYGKAGTDVSQLLVSARSAVEEAKEQQRRTIELQKDIRRLDKQLSKYDDELQTSIENETAASNEWQTVLSRLNLPADWDIELAREVIDKLNTTRVRLDALPGEDIRIAAMQSRIDEFDQKVRALCDTIQPESLRDPAELAIKKLEEQVEQAEEAQRKHDDFSQKLADARTDVTSLNERHTQHDSERVRLFALAEATSEEEFLDIALRAEKIIQLDGEIDRLMREVDLIRAGDSRDEFESSLSTSELAVLQGQERDTKDDLKTAEESRNKAYSDEGVSREALLRFDGSGTVAVLTEELSRMRSLLATEVDRYMPLVYARHLLSAAVNRFEKDNQPAMIATVSSLFSQMTGGKYVQFDRTGGGKQNVLVRRADGVEKTSDQLSTGTREQLYLAIRLAYVMHYCEQNQPLPIIIDDVLVNFDDVRATQTLKALAGMSQSAQVLFFTCHQHMVNIARDVVPGLVPIELPG